MRSAAGADETSPFSSKVPISCFMHIQPRLVKQINSVFHHGRANLRREVFKKNEYKANHKSRIIKMARLKNKHYTAE